MLAALFLAVLLQEPAPRSRPIERVEPRISPRVELRVSPLVDLWLEVRWHAEQPGTPEDEDLAAAVAAVRAVGEALSPSLGFGLVEANLEGPADAEELANAFEDMPKIFRSRTGAEVRLREPCTAAAAAVAVMEPDWRATRWPAREEELVAKKRALEEVLSEKGAGIQARLHRHLGLRVSDVDVPVYLVTRAPWPGAFTHRRIGGGGVAFVAIEDDLPALLESVLHETIHALDIETPGEASLLTELRTALTAAGLDPRATRDWVHTLFFLEAGACIRDRIDPEHVDYGDRTDLYARSRLAVDVERPLWRAYTAGELDRAELVAAIVAAATDGD